MHADHHGIHFRDPDDFDTDSPFVGVGPHKYFCNHPHHVDRRHVDPQGSWAALVMVVATVAGVWTLTLLFWAGSRLLDKFWPSSPPTPDPPARVFVPPPDPAPPLPAIDAVPVAFEPARPVAKPDAAALLDMALRLRTANPAACRRRLAEIVGLYPDSEQADAARRLLGE